LTSDLVNLFSNHKRNQGVQWVQARARNKMLGAEFMGVSCKCTSQGGECTPWEGRSHFLLVGGGCGV